MTSEHCPALNCRREIDAWRRATEGGLMSSVETVKGWARQIHSESEIPAYFLKAFQNLNLDALEFPLVLLSPAFKFGRDEITEKLLVRCGERIACMDRRKDLVKTTEVSVGDIHSVEWGTVLLHSWIAFHALGPLGTASIRVEFNTVCHESFRPLLRDFRRRHRSGSPLALDQELSRFDHLNRINYKFMNLARDSLEPGVAVQQFCLQGTVAGKVLGIFNVVRIPASMVIATQSELIVIREGDRKSQEYGGTWTYLLLDRIQQILVGRDEARHLLEMKVVLPGNAVVTCEYAYDKEGEVRAFVDGIRKEKSSIRG
jgi:hypothetical protein